MPTTDAFEGLRRKQAPEESNRGGQTAVQTPKNLICFLHESARHRATSMKLGLRSSSEIINLYIDKMRR